MNHYYHRYNWQYSFFLPAIYTFAVVLTITSRPFHGFGDPLILFNCFFVPILWLTMLTDRQTFDGQSVCQVSYILLRKRIPINEVTEIRYAPAFRMGNWNALFIIGTHNTITVNEMAYSHRVLRDMAKVISNANPRVKLGTATSNFIRDDNL
jgi:hypothetical protein